MVTGIEARIVLLIITSAGIILARRAADHGLQDIAAMEDAAWVRATAFTDLLIFAAGAGATLFCVR